MSKRSTSSKRVGAAERRTNLPDARKQPRFAGIPTFCRFPLAGSREAARTPDWAVYGVPYDSGVTYRPGARFGPRAVRDASQYMKTAHLEHGIDLAVELAMVDAGDAPVLPFHPKKTLDGVVEFAGTIGRPKKTRLLAIGGDHSIAYANIRATWERAGKPADGLAVLHFDAHLDTVDRVWDEKWSHASPFIRAIEEKLIDPTAMTSIGIRGPLNSLDDLNYARRKGIEIITTSDWQRADGEARYQLALERLGTRPVYLSFDIDVLDPAFAPGTGTPCCGGMTPTEIFAALRMAAGVRLVGADVVEVLPDRDVAGTTALLAAHVMIEILALGALAK